MNSMDRLKELRRKRQRVAKELEASMEAEKNELAEETEPIKECNELFIDKWHDTMEVLPDSDSNVWFIADGKYYVGIYEPEQKVFCMADGFGVELKDVRQWKYAEVNKQLANYPEEGQIIAVEVPGFPCLISGMFTDHCVNEQTGDDFSAVIISEDYNFVELGISDAIDWKQVFSWYSLPEEPIVIKEPVGDSVLAVMPKPEEVVEITSEPTAEEIIDNSPIMNDESIVETPSESQITSAIVKANKENNGMLESKENNGKKLNESKLHYLCIVGKRDGYAPDQCDRTMTVGDMIEYLEGFDSDLPIYLNNDRGYTYGSVNDHSVYETTYNDGYDEDDEDEIDESKKSNEKKLNESIDDCCDNCSLNKPKGLEFEDLKGMTEVRYNGEYLGDIYASGVFSYRHKLPIEVEEYLLSCGYVLKSHLHETSKKLKESMGDQSLKDFYNNLPDDKKEAFRKDFMDYMKATVNEFDTLPDDEIGDDSIVYPEDNSNDLLPVEDEEFDFLPKSVATQLTEYYSLIKG